MACITMGLCLIAVLATALPSQAAASSNYVVGPCAFAAGGGAQSLVYEVQVTLGAGPASARAFAGSYRLEGGLIGGIGASIGAAPWITGVEQPRATMRGQAALTIRGTGLLSGASPQLAIGGVPAAIQTRTNGEIVTTLPDQPAPGWRAVTFSSLGRTATLERGVAVLPMIDVEPAPGLGVPFDLVYRGTQGDLMMFAFSFAPGPHLPLAGLGHGLELDIHTLVNLGILFVGDPDGVLRVPVVALHSPLPVLFQGVALSNDPGYSPGAFTNVVSIFR